MTEKLDMLIFGAHPDDAEIGMGATIAKHARLGWRIGICDLTRAEMSSNGTVEQRMKEAKRAGEILGLAVRTNLELPDRGLSFCEDAVERITLEIRKYRPELVFAPYWNDRHPDHVMCSRLVEEAVFNAKLRNYRPEVEAVTVRQLIFYFIHQMEAPDLAVNVTETHKQKMEALAAYKSQFFMDSQGGRTVPTVLNQGYLEQVAARDRMLGHTLSVGYAEGFKTKNPYLLDGFRTSYPLGG